MAIYVGIRDGMDNSTEKDLMAIIEDIFDHDGGIVSAGHFIVEEQDTPAMAVDIDTGRAYVWCSSLDTFMQVVMDAADSLNIDSNSSGSTRIDLICIKIDVGATPDANAANVASLVVVKGTPGAGAPSTPANHYKLAEITVADGETEITDSEITDRRSTLKITAGMFNLLTDGNIEVNETNPWRTITLTPGFLKPTTTAPCAASETIEAGTNDIDYDVLAFDKDGDENAFGNIHLPDSYDGGPIQFRFIWTCAAGDGGAAETVVIEVSGRAYADGDAIDQVVGTPVEVSDIWQADGDIHISAWSGNVTLAGGPAAGEWIHLEIMRDVSEDDLGGDAQLIAVQIRFKQAKYSD